MYVPLCLFSKVLVVLIVLAMVLVTWLWVWTVVCSRWQVKTFHCIVVVSLVQYTVKSTLFVLEQIMTGIYRLQLLCVAL